MGINPSLLAAMYNTAFTAAPFDYFTPSGGQGPFVLALYTSNPGTTGSVGEITDSAYSRQNVTFATATGGTLTTSNTVVFNLTGGASPVITYAGVFGYNGASWEFLFGASLSSSVANSTQLTISAGQLSFTIS